MTSNRDRADRAVEILCDMIGCDALTASETLGELIDQGLIPDIYEEAAAAGVLSDDLPAPSRTMFPGGRVWHIDGPVGDVRATSTGQVVAFGTWQEQPFRIVSTPEKMRTLARTLKAAADHAEKAAAHVGETLGDTDDAKH